MACGEMDRHLVITEDALKTMNDSKAAIDKFLEEFLEDGKAKIEMIKERLPIAAENLKKNYEAQNSNIEMQAKIN